MQWIHRLLCLGKDAELVSQGQVSPTHWHTTPSTGCPCALPSLKAHTAASRKTTRWAHVQTCWRCMGVQQVGGAVDEESRLTSLLSC